MKARRNPLETKDRNFGALMKFCGPREGVLATPAGAKATGLEAYPTTEISSSLT